MADCKTINAELSDADEQLAAIQIEKDRLLAESVAKQEAGDFGFQTFSMVDGTKVRANPMEFWKDLEKMRLGMGDEALRASIHTRFDEGFTPKGSKGFSINYSTMPFRDDNVMALLEFAGLRRSDSKAGRELMMPYTTEVAAQEMQARLAMTGGFAEEIAREMTRRVSAYKKLPMDMNMAYMMRNDSSRHLAGMLEEVAENMDWMGVTPGQQASLARAAQYVNLFEQLDALLSRKVGQALAARREKFTAIDLNQLLDANIEYEDIRQIGARSLEEGSLAEQIMNAINSGDADELKKIAMVKTFDATKDIKLNSRNVFSEIELLNAYRKENLFSGVATVGQRTVVGGLTMGLTTGFEDVYQAFWRGDGVRDTFRAAHFGAKSVAEGFGAGWRAAARLLDEGVPTWSRGGVVEEVRMDSMPYRKVDAIADMNDAWDTFMGKNDVEMMSLGAQAIPFWRWINAGSRYLIGTALENAPGMKGTTAGYRPVWSLMGANDEVLKKMAFDWTVGRMSYQEAVELYDGLDVKPAIPRSEWLALKAEELTQEAVFSGVMTDEQLNALRRNLGTRQFGDKSNEALRLQIFNEQAGLPDPSNPKAQAGLRRGQEITLTQPLEGIGGRLDSLRRFNPEEGIGSQAAAAGIGWNMPVFQSVWNGLTWVFNRDFYVASVKTLYSEAVQAKAKLQQGGIGALVPERLGGPDISDMDLPIDPEVMAHQRALMTTATLFSLTAMMLHDAGILTDGGPFNQGDVQDERERNQTPRYSLTLGLQYANLVGNGGKFALSKLQIPGQTIDVIDMLGVQLDAQRAWKEGRISQDGYLDVAKRTALAYARLLRDKNTLDGVMSLINVMTNTQATGGEKAVEVLQSQMNGIFPMSGLLRDASQGLRDPNLAQDRRRSFTNEEQAKLGWLEQDEFKWIPEFYQAIFKDMPVLGEFGSNYSSVDWIGRKLKKPFGLPIDCMQPFAPCIVEDQGIDDWLDQKGLGGVPVADGKLSAAVLNKTLGVKEFGSATMTMDEEKVFRKFMYERRGEIPVETLLGESNAYIQTANSRYNVNYYTKGNTLLEAIQKLRDDPEFNLDMESTGVAADSPGARQLPVEESGPAGRRRAADLSRSSLELQSPIKVYDAIITYYTHLGAQGLATTEEGNAYYNRAWETRPTQVQNERLLEQIEGSPLGLSPQ